MASDGKVICSLIVLLLSIGFLVWGIQDLLKKQSPTEATVNDVISRQLKGFGFIVISGLVLGLGKILCDAMTGGLGSIMK